MSEHNLSRIQKFFKFILPASWIAAMEAESRQWIMRCPNCIFERSVWEMGGVRWKSAGNQEELMTELPPRSGHAYKVRRSNQKQYLTCPNCKQGGWNTLYKRFEQ